MPALRSTAELGLKPDFIGKVRDVFDLGDSLLIVATDRISAFDVIMNDVVPGRGAVLNVMTLAWLDRFRDLPNHLLSADPRDYPPPFRAHADRLGGRSVLVRKAKRYDAECVVRGYLAGSGWKSYRRDGTICGHRLPPGLRLADRLPEPLFTPSTKAAEGHDENIDFAAMCEIVGAEAGARLRDLALRLYRDGAAHAEPRGVILADTKFEFGLIDGEIAIIDEVLTPDSSRFWPVAEHRPGEDPPSFDKQILRSWLETLDWNHAPPPPRLPAEIIAQTSRRYREVLEILFPEEAAKWAPYL
ncbi:MAG TPA: phosphoribosylaminoimidazolesuccinocarboxamide synthase [Candidatus Krumholzibacteria bacterium]|nr:phosphoribosylaminoimidazolesuccinocarboxamide synthase [Candidatus Krumholzibacteria bacterium]HPD71597.1 phosphoribosylaminoimidazolesuccinocarboxamide synthase [Candidatus Krumholzibacteria bacterium]HRY41470.1 phosphoribosylaminoimidazolesuccinocarboxamide synthase [Candidatus Krumholzibacteria bacterium]